MAESLGLQDNNSNKGETEKRGLIIKCWNSLKRKPKCIVLDLDYTFWPFILDSQIIPPFKQIKKSDESIQIIDHNKKKVSSYSEIPLILKTLREECFHNNEYYFAIASRSTTPFLAQELLDLLGLLDYFDSLQIYSGSKLKHMKQIKTDLKNLNYDQILFFDDNKSNLSQTENVLGVVGYQVRRHHGLNVNELINGLKKFSNL